MGEDGIQAAIAEASDTFQKRYKSRFSGEERYWEQAIVLAAIATLRTNDRFRSRFFRRCKGNDHRRQRQLRRLFVL